MNKVRKIFVAVLVLVAFLLAGCNSEPPAITSGTVIGKEFTPEQWLMIPVPVSCGQNCTTTTLVSTWEPPRYRISIGACDGSDCLTETFAVEPSTFDDLEIGDEYPRTAPAVPKAAA